MDDSSPAYASPWRRIAAGLYDLLPVAAILMIASLAAVALHGGRIPPGTLWYQAYLGIVAFAYYGVSWKLGGQTIGMKAWRLRMVHEAGAAMGWPQVALRFAVAVVSVATFGVGVFAAWFDPRRRMLHDDAAGTVVVVLPKRGLGAVG